MASSSWASVGMSVWGVVGGDLEDELCVGGGGGVGFGGVIVRVCMIVGEVQ